MHLCYDISFVRTWLYHCKLTKNKSVGRKIQKRIQSERIKTLLYLVTERANNIKQRKKGCVKYICLNKWKEQTLSIMYISIYECVTTQC